MVDESIEALSFDAAGTLIRPLEPVGVTYARCAARYGGAHDAQAIEAAFRRLFAQQPALAFPCAGAVELAGHEFVWWRQLVRGVMDSVGGIADFDAFFAELFAHYAHGEAWVAYADVRPVLDELRARGLRLAVVSNFDSRLEAILAELELRPFFDVVICSSAAGSAKPDPQIFALASAQLRVAPAAILHVGDSRDADFDGARAAGYQARWLVRGAATPPDAINSLAELMKN